MDDVAVDVRGCRQGRNQSCRFEDSAWLPAASPGPGVRLAARLHHVHGHEPGRGVDDVAGLAGICTEHLTLVVAALVRDQFPEADELLVLGRQVRDVWHPLPRQALLVATGAWRRLQRQAIPGQLEEALLVRLHPRVHAALEVVRDVLFLLVDREGAEISGVAGERGLCFLVGLLRAGVFLPSERHNRHRHVAGVVVDDIARTILVRGAGGRRDDFTLGVSGFDADQLPGADESNLSACAPGPRQETIRT